jgi:hypothetical protein
MLDDPWAAFAPQPEKDDPWAAFAPQSKPQPDQRQGPAIGGLATLPAQLLNRVARGQEFNKLTSKADPSTPREIIDDDWERLIDAGIVSDPYTGRPGLVHARSPEDAQKLSGWEQIKNALSSDIGRFVEGMKTLPMRAFQESERERTQGEFDPGTMLEAAMFGRQAPVSIMRPRVFAGKPEPQEIGTMPTPEDFATAAKATGGNQALFEELRNERGIHPAEAAHDAQTDPMLAHDLGAAATEPPDLPPADVPFSAVPPPPPGRRIIPGCRRPASRRGH